jgi:hypothetical protein
MHGDDLVVALAAQPSRIKRHRPVQHLRRQIPHGRRLVGGRARSPAVAAVMSSSGPDSVRLVRMAAALRAISWILGW